MDMSKSFVENLPSADEIIRALGLQLRQRNGGSEVAASVALFGAGLLVGAGLALLFAPTTGRELREEIGERAADLRERAAAAMEQGSHAAGHVG